MPRIFAEQNATVATVLPNHARLFNMGFDKDARREHDIGVQIGSDTIINIGAIEQRNDDCIAFRLRFNRFDNLVKIIALYTDQN